MISITTISAQSQYDIPAWVKGVAGFWAEDKISDAEFGEGLSFLIDNGIIKVPLITQLENRISELDDQNQKLIQENLRLRSQLENVPTTPTDSTITVTTDKSTYHDGEIIGISGKVSEYLSGVPISLRMLAPSGNIVTVSQVSVSSDNTFRTQYDAGGSLMREEGKYTITVIYGTSSNRAQTDFDFIKTPASSSDSGVTSLKTSNPSFSIDDKIGFVGTQTGKDTVFVTIHGPDGRFKGMLADPSPEQGKFNVIPQDADQFFDARGTYSATAFTDNQKESDGFTIYLKFDGTTIFGN